MHREVVDGVPVLWTPAPGPLTAGLVFGVGRRDESFLTGGITHLVEHLAMGALGRTTLDGNATVDLTTTVFHASGEPGRVAQFLRQVCTALDDLPLHRLAVEAGVLRTEAGAVAAPAVAALLGERYGASGAGLAGFGEPALLALSADEVRQWAATRFVRGAAALWLTGPPPPGLSLPLVDAAPPARPPQRVRVMTTPALVEHGVDAAVALGADVERCTGLGATVRTLRARVEDDLRHRRGLSYGVASEQLAVDATRRFVAVTADCPQGREAVVARATWQHLVRLAESGATEQELAHDREELAELLADERSLAEEVRAAAEALVTGVPHRSRADLRQESAQVTVDDVRSAAQAFVDGALLGVPYGTELAVSALTPLTSSGEVVTGESFPRRRTGSQAPRGARLVVGVDGATVVLDDDERLTVRYADAVGLLEVAAAQWTLVGLDGTALPLAAGDWRDGERALELVRAAVPSSLQAAADSTVVPGRRVLLLHAPPSTAFEALWPSKLAAWVVQTPSWTLALRDEDDVEAYAGAAGTSAVVGRQGAVLLLELAHDELRLVLFRRGRERDRHLWDGEAHDPSPLAEALRQDPEQVAALLALDGPPADVLLALERVLGVPPQAARLLAGADPGTVDGMVLERARGVRESVVAAARGEYDPPDSPKLSHRLARWERERPPAYRLGNAGAAAVQAALAVAVSTRVDGDVSSGAGVLTVLLGLGALGSAWSVRPPRR